MAELPDWYCRDREDVARFESWTNTQLDLVFDKHYFENKTLDQKKQTPIFVTEFFIEHAIRQRDIEYLVKASEDEVIRRRLISGFLKSSGRGSATRSAKGFEELRNNSCGMLRRLQFASQNVDWVRNIWRQHYGKRTRERDTPPTAIDIVARRFERMGQPIDVLALEDLRRKLERPAPDRLSGQTVASPDVGP